jgi:hypothetical protein
MRILRGAIVVLAALLLTTPSVQARRPVPRGSVRMSEARKPRAGGSKATPDKAPAEKAVAVSKDRGSESDTADSGAATTTGGKTLKTKTYNFSAMDVEGKLKTPQLLYFLDRVKLELDMSAPDKRSFMKELEKSADDGAL